MRATTATDQPRPDAAAVAEATFPYTGKNCFFVGIGGCGMAGLARLFRARGAAVRGVDMQRSPITDALAEDGFSVDFDEQAGALPDSADLVVASAAVRPDHAIMLEAQRRGVPALTYAEALGRCMLGRTGVALAGTHGKSTTAAMLGFALVEAGLEPSVIVGATCRQLADQNGPARIRPTGFRQGADRISDGALHGRPGLLIAEACEFNRSFHNLNPVVASISAVEADHLDIYGDMDAVIDAFHEFARLLPSASEGGKLIIAHDGAHRREVASGIDAVVETIGFAPSADWRIEFDPPARRVVLSRDDAPIGSWTLNIPGEHMAFNSALACALAVSLGADPQRVADALSRFQGVDRRVQFLGERRGVRVYDDYGHHPTEIDATLRALRQFEQPENRGGRLICVFQPHQHSRTRFFLEEFAQSFSPADVVIVPHIYFVRDSEIEKTKVRAADLVDRLRKRGVQAMHLYPFEAIIEQLENICRPGDLLVVMGAGPVWQVARGFLESGAASQQD